MEKENKEVFIEDTEELVGEIVNDENVELTEEQEKEFSNGKGE